MFMDFKSYLYGEGASAIKDHATYYMYKVNLNSKSGILLCVLMLYNVMHWVAQNEIENTSREIHRPLQLKQFTFTLTALPHTIENNWIRRGCIHLKDWPVVGVYPQDEQNMCLANMNHLDNAGSNG